GRDQVAPGGNGESPSPDGDAPGAAYWPAPRGNRCLPLACVFDPDKVGRTEFNLRIRLDPFDGSGMV
ncbi:phage integrase family site specific recombinase, partial [Pseudomonas sp. FEN]